MRARTGKAMLTAHNLSKRFGDRRVFAGVDLELADGARLLVTGPNGSGKTTLLRVLAGLAAPTSGELELPHRSRVGYLGHEPLVYRELTPLENLTLFARLYRLREGRERAGMLLERFGLWDVRHDRVSTFSRGMQQRLALCRVLLHEPELLLLDEPFNALDADAAALLERTLEELSGRTLVVATHDPARVERLATHRLAFG
jgi:heme exporter protein A